MARYRDITFGATSCRILVRTLVHSSGMPHSSEATAFVGNEQVTERGQRVERYASTDGQAIEMMSAYLETRYGPRQEAHPSLGRAEGRSDATEGDSPH